MGTPALDTGNFKDTGYMILKHVIPRTIIDQWATKISNYVENGGPLAHRYHGKGDVVGWTIADFAEDKDFMDIADAIHTNKAIHGAVSEVFGASKGSGKGQYRFVSHDNINVLSTVGWHKDRLNSIYRQYEVHNPWDRVNGEEMHIVKVALYLESHKLDQNALTLIPGSHMTHSIPAQKRNSTSLNPEKGDVIIFDQRISHRGSEQPTSNQSRIMIQMGYGMNNIFSDEFEVGTRMRQSMLKSCDGAYNSCASARVAADLKRRALV